MAIIAKVLRSGIANLAVLIAFVAAAPALACATCGLSASYTPRMFLISTGFVFLPSAFVAFIAWRLWLDHKHEKKVKNRTNP